jgi:ribosome-binding factor A
MSQRTERVDELLRQEIGALLAKEVADPRIGFATITDVETAPDLRHAKVWVSVIGEKGDRDDTLRALRSAMPFIRHELGKRLRIKRIPDLHVHLDDTAGRATRVLHLLDELERGVDPDEIAPIKESLPTPVKRLPHEGDMPDADEPGAADGAVDPVTGMLDAAGLSGGGVKPSRGKPGTGRRPSTQRGPGGRPAGRGAPGRTPRRGPRSERG